MKQMKKYLFRLVAFLGLTITPFIASAEEVSLGESISKFLNDTGFARLVEGNWLCLVMIAVACLLFYLAIVKKFEPLLLLPIAFGMLLTNLPGAGLYHPELFEGGHIHWPDFANANNVGLLDYIYLGVKLGIYPCVIFIGVGAMTDRYLRYFPGSFGSRIQLCRSRFDRYYRWSRRPDRHLSDF